MSLDLDRRLRGLRARVLVRRWEYRQSRTAKGVWFRLRRFLAFAAEAYAVPEEEAERLRMEGYAPDPVGLELEPPKYLACVPRERIERIEKRKAIGVSLGPEMLEARSIVVVGFETSPRFRRLYR
jgi:hypothetical protein